MMDGWTDGWLDGLIDERMDVGMMDIHFVG